MGSLGLPPGFRFCPTDVELIMFYLKRKATGQPIGFNGIPDIDLYQFDPWELPDQSCLNGKYLEWYFFCPHGKKYAKGTKVNRATTSGQWKTTGKDKPVYNKSVKVGMRRTLVFRQGKTKREKTSWLMYEYRLLDGKMLVDKAISQDEYVLCKVIKKVAHGPENGELCGFSFNEEERDDDGSEINDQMFSCSHNDLSSSYDPANAQVDNSSNSLLQSNMPMGNDILNFLNRMCDADGPSVPNDTYATEGGLQNLGQLTVPTNFTEEGYLLPDDVPFDSSRNLHGGAPSYLLSGELGESLDETTILHKTNLTREADLSLDVVPSDHSRNLHGGAPSYLLSSELGDSWDEITLGHLATDEGDLQNFSQLTTPTNLTRDAYLSPHGVTFDHSRNFYGGTPWHLLSRNSWDETIVLDEGSHQNLGQLTAQTNLIGETDLSQDDVPFDHSRNLHRDTPSNLLLGQLDDSCEETTVFHMLIDEVFALSE